MFDLPDNFERTHMSRLRMFLAALVASIAIANVLYAQHPILDSLNALRPRHLEAGFSDSTVHLRWHRPETSTDPSWYRIYRSSGMAFPGFLGSGHDTTYDDTTVLLQTTYHYFVTAVYHDTSESFPSNIVEIFTGTGDSDHHPPDVRIVFTTKPPRTAIVNHAFTYDADAMSFPAGIPVCFKLKDAPDGMTIDSASGVVNWTPEREGCYEVEIIAHTCDTLDGRAEQEFNLYVFSGAPGSVAGTVRNDSGEAVRHVKVKLFDVGRGDFVMKTSTDDSGHYNFPMVNPVTYYLRAEPDKHQYLSQWYNGAEHIENATPVVVPESGAVSIDITLKKKGSDRFRIGGTVLNDSLQPVSGAKVVASLLGHDRRSDDRFDDFHDAKGHDGEDDQGDHDGGDHHPGDDHAGTAVTDSNGHYSMVLHGGTYIISASAKHYLSQFWNHKPTPLEADPLDLAADTTGIDFTLQRVVVATGSISGHILYAADSTAAESDVMAFRKDSSGHFTRFKSSVDTDTSGAYTLGHLPDGSYVILAKDEKDIIPTFYNLSGGTSFLDSASTVTVSGGAAVAGIDIYVKVDSVDGLNSVKGMITLDTSPSGGIVPVAGVIVILSGSDGAVAGSAVSEGDGSYLAVGLAPDTYTLIFQMPGLRTASARVPVRYENNAPTTSTANVRLVEGTGDLTLGDQPGSAAPMEFMLYQNYPNPFNPTTRIAFDLPEAAQVTLRIYNVIGQEVATLAENTRYGAGRHALVLDASTLGSGLYFAKLQAGSNSIVRKMLLVR
jgi:hypothetical protein